MLEESPYLATNSERLGNTRSSTDKSINYLS